MPYPTNSDLPPSVQSHLPEHAQSIYRGAFNNAYAEHEGDPRQEEAAHRIAWAAVKRTYAKVGNTWIARTDAG
jgi:cation transport regulator